MATFNEVFKTQALKDKLPFGIDFTINQVQSTVYKDVAGYKLPVIDDLTSGETWFFEVLNSLNESTVNEASLLLRALGKKLQITCNISTLSEALTLLFEPSEELATSLAYEQFIEDNYAEIERISAISKLASDELSKSWLRITFFMLSRFDSNWQFSDTVNLRTKEIELINEFIVLESNHGKTPEIQIDSEDLDSPKKN